MKRDRYILVTHNDKGFWINVMDKDTSLGTWNATTASVRRINRILHDKCMVSNEPTLNPYTNAVQIEYIYLPDANFVSKAKRIDGGASNPLAVVNTMHQLAVYRVRVQQSGMNFSEDSAWQLMINQLGYITAGTSIPFEAYTKARREVDDEK